MTIASRAYGVFPIAYGLYPQEGSRAVSLQYNWTAQSSYTEDLSQLVARGIETTIQAVYFDNSGVSQYVTLYIGASGQVAVLPPTTQGVLPLFFTGTPVFSLSIPNSESSVTRLLLLNVPPQTVGIWTA